MNLTLTPGNPMGKVLRANLFFESIVAALAVAGMIQVAEIDVTTALVAGLGVALLALVAAGRFAKPGGQWLGWATQVALVALGLLAPEMYLMGGIFALVYVTTFALGRRLDPR